MSRVGYASVGGGTFGVAAFVGKFNSIHLVGIVLINELLECRPVATS